MPGGGSREPATPDTVAASRHRVFMPNGREVFKRAVTEMAASCREVLEKNGHTHRRRRPADPPPGERPDHERGRRAAAHPARQGGDRRRRGRQHVGAPRSRSRSTAPGAPAGCTRATSSCSPRSAPGSRGARRLMRWTIAVSRKGRDDLEGRGRHRRVPRDRPRVRGRARRVGLDRGDRVPDERGRREGDARGARGDRHARASRSTSTSPTRRASPRRSGGCPTRPGTSRAS